MAIAQIPQQVASTAKEAALEVRDRLGQTQGFNRRCTRALAMTSLITGAVLLARGRRRTGFALTAVGTVFALLEDPGGVAATWNSIPTYIQTGKRLLSKVEGFVEDISSQGEKLRTFLEKVER